MFAPLIANNSLQSVYGPLRAIPTGDISMTYVPIALTEADFDSILIRNIYRLIDEYKLTNSYITVQDREKSSTYPLYTIYIPKTEKSYKDNKRNTTYMACSIQIDFDALPASGDWQKTAEMFNALEVGIKAEQDAGTLNTAGLKYNGSEVLANEPININRQQVFSKSVRFDFTTVIRG